MRLQRLPDNHYGIDGIPVYEIVAKYRRWCGLTAGQFAKLHGVERSSQYRFEAGKVKNLAFAIEQLRLIGYRVDLSVYETSAAHSVAKLNKT